MLCSTVTLNTLLILLIAWFVVKSFQSALGLLEEANSHGAKLLGRDTVRLCKLLNWMMLMTKIQHCLHELPCVDSKSPKLSFKKVKIL